eukprot:TRINITY_DN56495_c0_g1_i1.p1 TRINITY_DN56495_c0_g1~~TRINITY_DN56495_c0_g1_i1.p1  ORF type:complete len:654 (-),score=111.70 TRINITY_DN56495_c0_g1_i1:155-1876(-)
MATKPVVMSARAQEVEADAARLLRDTSSGLSLPSALAASSKAKAPPPKKTGKLQSLMARISQQKKAVKTQAFHAPPEPEPIPEKPEKSVRVITPETTSTDDTTKSAEETKRSGPCQDAQQVAETGGACMVPDEDAMCEEDFLKLSAPSQPTNEDKEAEQKPKTKVTTPWLATHFDELQDKDTEISTLFQSAVAPPSPATPPSSVTQPSIALPLASSKTQEDDNDRLPSPTNTPSTMETSAQLPQAADNTTVETKPTTAKPPAGFGPPPPCTPPLDSGITQQSQAVQLRKFKKRKDSDNKEDSPPSKKKRSTASPVSLRKDAQSTKPLRYLEAVDTESTEEQTQHMQDDAESVDSSSSVEMQYNKKQARRRREYCEVDEVTDSEESGKDTDDEDDEDDGIDHEEEMAKRNSTMLRLRWEMSQSQWSMNEDSNTALFEVVENEDSQQAYSMLTATKPTSLTPPTGGSSSLLAHTSSNVSFTSSPATPITPLRKSSRQSSFLKSSRRATDSTLEMLKKQNSVANLSLGTVLYEDNSNTASSLPSGGFVAPTLKSVPERRRKSKPTLSLALSSTPSR